jgi:DNA-binding FadR family transcriptional regulator
MSHSEPIARRKLSDEVFLRLKRLITSGELKPGDEMPSVRELMDRFDVGRPAILKLTPSSIFKQVDIAAKIMLSSSQDSLEHLKSARIFFERGMAREAATKATSEDIARLRATLAQQCNLRDDPEAFIAMDMRLHTHIAAISGNPLYVAVSEAMLGWLKEYHTEMLIWTGKEKFTLAEHAEIIECIEQRDPHGAEQAMIRHLERSRALYMLNSTAGS